MARSKRNGWVRLGVVLSLAWLLGVLVYAGVEYHYTLEDLTSSVQSPDPALKPGGWEVIGQESLVINCGVREKQVSCSLRLGNLALLIFGPIAAAWLVVLAFVYAAMWVRAGFRDET